MGVASENTEDCAVCGKQKAIGFDCLWCHECPICDRMVAELTEYAGHNMCEQCAAHAAELDDHTCSG